MFDLNPITNKTETIEMIIIRNFHLFFIYGINKTNKLIGIIILEYSSGLVASPMGISKKPNGKRILKQNERIVFT